MKITAEHFAQLSAMLTPLDIDDLRTQYKAKGLTDKRYRWDLLWAAGCTTFLCKVLYKYMDDTHVDTALRSIVKPLS